MREEGGRCGISPSHWQNRRPWQLPKLLFIDAYPFFLTRVGRGGGGLGGIGEEKGDEPEDESVAECDVLWPVIGCARSVLSATLISLVTDTRCSSFASVWHGLRRDVGTGTPYMSARGYLTRGRWAQPSPAPDGEACRRGDHTLLAVALAQAQIFWTKGVQYFRSSGVMDEVFTILFLL